MLATQERTIGQFNIDDVTPAPLRLVKRVRLEASKEEVFALVSDHVGMPAWFPLVQSVKMDNRQAEIDGGTGAVRTCTLNQGAVLTENIVAYDAPTMFAYGVADGNAFGAEGHLAVVELEATGEGETLLTWRQYFNHADVAWFTQNTSEVLDGGIQGLIERFGGELLETTVLPV